MIENGKTVKVHYKGTLADGEIFDTSEGREPLEFEMGAGQVIPGFETAIAAMAAGETKTITIPCDEAYGQPSDNMVGEVPRDKMPEGLDLQVGIMLEMHSDKGVMPCRIVAVGDDTVTVDANHPLAGQELTFELTVVEVA